METSEFEEIVAAVRRLVREDVVPREDEIERDDEIPADLRRKAVEMGLFGYTLPEEYGGLAASLTQDVQLALELGYTTPAFRSMFGINNGIAGKVLADAGTQEQQAAWLPRLAGGAVASFALTEPEAGSDPSGLSTRAVRDGEDWVISGAKRFITNAPLADLFVVFARTAPGAPGAQGTRGTRGISVFLVDAALPGVSVGPRDHKMGQFGAWSAEVFLDSVRVPRSALVGAAEGAGFGEAMKSLVRGRVHIAALCVGMAQRLLEESVAHARVSRQAARRSDSSSWCRRCSRRSRPACMRGVRWCSRRRGTTTQGRTGGSGRRRPSCTARRWSTGPRTWRCRSTAAWATCAAPRWSGCTATPGSSVSTRAPARSRN
jgi:acyl-CoA dehydrogenase